MSTLLKLADDSFDFSSYIKTKGYQEVENPVETKSKTTSSGYENKTFATYHKAIIEVTFKPGLDKDDVAAIMAAFKDAGDKAEYIYWSAEEAALRQAYFFLIESEAPSVISTNGDYQYDDWTVTLEQAGIAADVAETVVSAFAGTVTDKSGTWADEANIQADNGLYCTCPGATNVNQQIVLSNFGFTIPAGATINYVEIEMEYKVSTADSSIVVYVLPAYKGVGRGTGWASYNEPLTDITETIRFSASGWTVDQLNSIYSQIYIGYKRYIATACTISINYAKMIISYTEVG